MFDLSNITLAFVQAHDAASSFDAMCADMVQWHQSGVYPCNKDLIAALVAADRWSLPTCKVYASNLLTWAKSGQTPRNIRQIVNGKPADHVKGKGGRPAGKGAGKSTKPADAGVDEAVAALPNNDAAWLTFIEGMRNKVPARKEWPADRIVAFQESCARLIALIRSK